MTRTTKQFYSEQTLFSEGTEGYGVFRIPSLIKAGNGDILAVCEGRSELDDFGKIKIVMKRSTDNGRKWSGISIIAENGNYVTGNPSLVVDAMNPLHPNRIFLSYNICKNNETDIMYGKGVRETMVKYSDDDGYTWSNPVNITASVSKPKQNTEEYHYNFEEDWRWYAVSPCHAIQLTKGKYAGRLLFSANHTIGDGAYLSDLSNVFYSDDHGATWQLGGSVNMGGSNECTVIELDNGDIMINCRVFTNHQRYRYVSTSKDGGESWGDMTCDTALPDPGCQASLLRYSSGEVSRILFSNSASAVGSYYQHIQGRDNMTVRLSYDEGATWEKSRIINNASGAYSDMVKQQDNNIGILYELCNYSKINYCSFNLEWLTDGTDSLSVAYNG